MTRPEGKVLPAIRMNVPKSAKVLIAVSGGRDSMCLVHGCHELSRELKLQMEVAHLDHNLRESSGSDAEFVREWCSAKNIRFHFRKEEPPPQGQNVEGWGRERRYVFFREVLHEQGLDYILTAHTADDAAETLLMRLVANKELRGIAAKDERSRRVRPLLFVSREEIDRYISSRNVPFVEDLTNQDTSMLRNKVRHLLIPFLKKEFDPRIVEVLSTRARYLDEDEASLTEIALKRLETLRGLELESSEYIRAFRAASDSMPSGVTWRMLEQIFLPLLGHKISRAHAKEAFDVVLGKRAGKEFPGGKSLRRRKGRVKIDDHC